MRIHILRAASIVYTLAMCWPVSGTELACTELTPTDRPAIPAAAKLLKSGEGYFIYELNSEKRMLFDARVAVVLQVNPDLNKTAPTLMLWSKADEAPYVQFGIHRAVTASHGLPIRRELGGTDWKYWLDYPFADSGNHIYDPGLLYFQHQRVVDMPITWDPSKLAEKKD